MGLPGKVTFTIATAATN